MASQTYGNSTDPAGASATVATPAPRSILLNVQYLRAFAAINVVMLHVITASRDYDIGLTYLGHLGNWGANGVDIFFVISGFVMYFTQHTKRVSPAAFFKMRFLRIAPLYYLLTAAVALVAIVAPSAFRSLDVSPQHLWTSFAFVSQLIDGSQPVIFVGWTLEWEMLFYAIFSASLFFSSFGIVIASVIVALVALAAVSGNLIVLEFMLGIVCGYLHHRLRIGPKWGAALLAGGAILLMASIAGPVAALPIDRLFLWGIPSFFIVLGAITSRQFDSRLLGYLGDASYSIYLVHVFTISLFYKVVTKLALQIDGDVLALACLTGSVVGGCAVHTLIEKPLTATLRRVAA